MAYSGDMQFGDWQREMQSKARGLLDAIKEGKRLYDKFYKMTYGLSDAQILELPQLLVAGDVLTQAKLTELRYAVGVFNTLNAGSALDPATRDDYLTPFL
jgi:hypothetical protein